MAQEHSTFYRMWNSNRGKKIISAAYSLGASVVILGALFKILHLAGANYMLMAGMITESVIFAGTKHFDIVIPFASASGNINFLVACKIF